MPDPDTPEVLKYSAVQAAIAGRRAHLLLGNGFSIACDPIFQYGSLYEEAVAAGLSNRAQQVFEYLGTNNFEGVLRLLHDAHWVADRYEIPPVSTQGMVDDSEVVKRTLVEAVTKSHLAHTGCVEDVKKDTARSFLAPYYNVFTTNYDLLLYWVVLHGGKPSHQDGFRPPDDDPTAQHLVFSERLGGNKGIFHLHGALHMHLVGGELRKHSWGRTGQRLTDQIRAGLAASEYPLFVAEGKPEQKLAQIQRVGYLWYCLDKLARIEGPLVVYGHSLGQSDQHIADTIAGNFGLHQLYVSLHGDPRSTANSEIVRAAERIITARGRASRSRKDALSVAYFDATSAAPWG